MGQVRNLKKGRDNSYFNKFSSIEERNKAEAKECLKEIQESLNFFGCDMIPEFLISGSEIISRVKVIKRKEESKIINPHAN